MNTTVRITQPVAPHTLPRAVVLAQALLTALTGRAFRQVPAAIGPMTRTQEAAATREYAVQFFRSDPRFAADLCAAADRHERAEGH